MSLRLGAVVGEAAAVRSGEGSVPGASSPVVTVEQVTLGYGRRVVLRDVTLEIRQGEFWCLLGANGEGKTTLIKGCGFR